MDKLTDVQKELYEDLWGDLRAMYQRDCAMADNGIHFRSRIENFITDLRNSQKVVAADSATTNKSSFQFPSFEKLMAQIKDDHCYIRTNDMGRSGIYIGASKMYDLLCKALENKKR